MKLLSEKEKPASPLGLINYIVLNLDASHGVLGTTVATMNMMLGEKFYKGLVSSGLIPPFDGRTLSDLINYLKKTLMLCSMPVREIELSLKGGLLRAIFFEDVEDSFQILKELRKSKGWL